ncbi:MAG: TonB-dependent receptor, partial [Bryobacteraceae bacterium]
MNRTKYKAMAALAATAVFCLSAIPALAQETRATLSGTVTDPSGSAMAGAELHLVNRDTGVVFTAQSNQLGQYRFLFVNPGTYHLAVTMPGFRTYSRDGVQLTTGEAATIDVPLQVGEQTQTVTVSARAPLLDAEKADRGMVVTQNQLSQLPTLAKVPILMATLTPGVVWQAQSYNIQPFSNSGLSGWSINGSISPSAEFLLDGAPNDMIYQASHSIAYIPPMDAVAEFKVITGAYDAQYGRNGGGVMSIVLKSGANAYHGSGYEYMKRAFLDANSFANNANGSPRSYDKLDEFGFSAGGPVLVPKLYNGKERTFFFVAYEKFLQNTVARSPVSSVPTLAQRNGDFSQTFNNAGQLMPIYDPLTGHNVNGQWVRNAFPSNIIPMDRIDPVGSKIAGLYPLPNVNLPGPVNWQNNYFNPNDLTQYFFNNFVARMDQNFGDKERVYARYAYNNQLLHDDTNELPGMAADPRYGNKVNNAFVFDSVTILSPSSTLDLRASVNRWLQDYQPPNYGSYNATAIGWPASLVSQFPEPRRFPYFTLSNYQSLGSSGSNIWLAPTTTISLQPSIALQHGRHIIKAGLDYR